MGGVGGAGVYDVAALVWAGVCGVRVVVGVCGWSVWGSVGVTRMGGAGGCGVGVV